MKKINKKIYHWAVIGAGPAGIAAVGRLLDNGISADHILWCDPRFTVGDLGALWSNVSSNTKVKLFTNFLHASPSFAYELAASQFALHNLDPEETCTLHYVVEPLQWISEHLAKQVDARKSVIHTMSLANHIWCLDDGSDLFQAHNVILANGAAPANLNYSGVEIVPFEVAIDKERLAASLNLKETIGVFGSSHSAIIILRHLVELGAKKIINFYRSPCRYAVDMSDWILFDNTGLKGSTAQWAREHIDGVLPSNLFRYNTTEQYIARYLPECDKVIYAVGFEGRKNIVIGPYENMQYDPNLGIIGPGLFGLGIAYPELKADPYGHTEFQVGLWKFMNYLNRVLPLWFKYPA